MANVNPTNLASGFLPTLWTDAMLSYAEKQFRLKNLVTDFSSLASEMGSVIKVPQLNEPTSASAPTNSTAVVFQADDDAVGTITLDSHPYEARRIEDIASVQASSDLFDAYSKSLGYSVAKAVETEIATILKADTTNTAIDTGANDVLSTANVIAGLEVLWGNNIDAGAGDVYLFCSAHSYGKLLQEEEFTHYSKRGDDQNPNVSGALGMILGMPVFVSNDWVSAGADGTITASMFHRSSTGFAYSIDPRVQSQYNLEHIAFDVVADCVFGCDVLFVTTRVEFLCPFHLIFI
jgi:hypothetical protein